MFNNYFILNDTVVAKNTIRQFNMIADISSPPNNSAVQRTALTNSHFVSNHNIIFNLCSLPDGYPFTNNRRSNKSDSRVRMSILTQPNFSIDSGSVNFYCHFAAQNCLMRLFIFTWIANVYPIGIRKITKHGHAIFQKSGEELSFK